MNIRSNVSLLICGNGRNLRRVIANSVVGST
jgi:hypothetical protein